MPSTGPAACRAPRRRGHPQRRRVPWLGAWSNGLMALPAGADPGDPTKNLHCPPEPTPAGGAGRAPRAPAFPARPTAHGPPHGRRHHREERGNKRGAGPATAIGCGGAATGRGGAARGLPRPGTPPSSRFHSPAPPHPRLPECGEGRTEKARARRGKGDRAKAVPAASGCKGVPSGPERFQAVESALLIQASGSQPALSRRYGPRSRALPRTSG